MVSEDPLRLYSALLGGMLDGGQELFAAQEFLHTLIETLAVPVFIKDTESTFVGCNHAFAEYAGLTVGEIIGRSDAEMPWQELSGSDYVDWDRRVMASGVESLGISEPLRMADGSIRWLETDKYPFLAKDGTVIGLIGSSRDVTDRVQAQRELQRLVGSLDQQVDQQTLELERTNETLRAEMRERERLQIGEREQREQLEVLRDIASALSTTLDIDVVLDEVVKGVQHLLFVDLIAVVLAEVDGDFVVRRLDVTDEYPIDDALASTQVLAWLESDSGPGHGNGATCSVPLDKCFGLATSSIAAAMVVGGQRIGYLYVESRAGHLDTELSRDRLGAIAGQAAATMSTLRLSTAEADQAAVRERERLAKDLHDTVIQAVSTVSLLSSAALGMVDKTHPVAPLVERMHAAAIGSQAEMRSLVLEMRGDDLTKMSVRQLVETAIAVFSARSSVEVIADLADIDLDRDTSITLYRIVQEALNNVVRHADATTVQVTLENNPVRIQVRDDGSGFDASGDSPGHLGLQIMGERASSIGGVLTITTAAGRGTHIDVGLPSVGPQAPASPAETEHERADVPQEQRTLAESSSSGMMTAQPSRPYAVLMWLAVTLISGAAALGLWSMQSTASEEARAATVMADRTVVLEARTSVVRALLAQYGAALLEPFGLINDQGLDVVSVSTETAIDQARQDLGIVAQSESSAAGEARRVLDMFERWEIDGDGGSENPELDRIEGFYDRASEMQFDGVPPPARPPTDVDALGEFVYLDQAVQFVVIESLMARFALLDSPPEQTGAANSYLADALEVVLDDGGWLGPDASQPLIDGYIPIDLALEVLPDAIDELNDAVESSSVWVEDQWIRSLAENPASEPSGPVDPLVISASRVLFDMQRIEDAVAGEVARAYRVSADEAGRERLVTTVGAVVLLMLSLGAAGRTAQLLVARARLLAVAARTDPLTGIGNRKVLEDETSQLLSESDLWHHLVVAIDMDRFKLINDTYGHAFGDRLLQITAAGLREVADAQLADEATVVRLGGDEFLLTLHGKSRIDVTSVCAELDRLSERMVSAEDGSIVHPRFSYGIAVAEGSPDLQELMQQSDLAAYEQKAARRGQRTPADA